MRCRKLFEKTPWKAQDAGKDSPFSLLDRDLMLKTVLPPVFS
jgi:hypothetical protein